MKKTDPNTPFIFILQVASVSAIWFFVGGITIWMINLVSLSLRYQDALGASIGISLVAVPVFLGLASVLTYVFVGLRREFVKGRSENVDSE